MKKVLFITLCMLATAAVAQSVIEKEVFESIKSPALSEPNSNPTLYVREETSYVNGGEVSRSYLVKNYNDTLFIIKYTITETYKKNGANLYSTESKCDTIIPYTKEELLFYKHLYSTDEGVDFVLKAYEWDIHKEKEKRDNKEFKHEVYRAFERLEEGEYSKEEDVYYQKIDKKFLEDFRNDKIKVHRQQ